MNWQILDEKTILELLPDANQRTCKASDFSRLLGSYVRRMDDFKGGNTWWWLSTASPDEGAYAIDDYTGLRGWHSPRRRGGAVRPALPFSEISSICSSAARARVGESFESNLEYPGKVASKKLSDELERNYKSLRKTGRTYTVDSVPTQYESENYKKDFTPRKLEEVEYNGKKYVRIQAFAYESEYSYITRDGKNELIKQGDYYFVEVEKVKFQRLKDKSGKEYALAETTLFSGIQFDLQEDYNKHNYREGDKIDVSKHNIGKYLQNHFAKDIEQSLTATRSFVTKESVAQENDLVKAMRERQKNWGVSVNEAPMPIDKQIKFYVEHGKSFMLHGVSGSGKTKRVKELDPDLTFIHIPNGVLPETVLGKVIYPNGNAGIPTEFVESMRAFAKENGLDIENVLKESQIGVQTGAGQWKAPDWYVELCDKCEREPDKQHVLFIDELTNAKATTQSLVYHIILERSIGPNKGKLPENCVVVAAGNNKHESDAAYNMPEPLFRRFEGHVYIEPNVRDWLIWGSQKVGRKAEPLHRIAPSKEEVDERCEIHPLVAAFVASAPDCMITDFNPDKPPKYAIDQRGWDQVSDIIYDNKGEIRMGLIRNKVGDEIAAAFVAFAQNPPPSIEDVVKRNYTANDIPQTEDAKFVLASLLRYADERQVKVVREFVGTHLGNEQLAIYDSLWSDGDSEKEVFLKGQKLDFGKEEKGMTL